MKKSVLFTIYLLISAPLFSTNHGKILGDWKVDIEKSKNAKENSRIFVDSTLKSFFKEYVTKVKFYISKDTLIIDSRDIGRFTVKYKVVENKNKTIIAMANEQGNKVLITFTVLSDSSIKLFISKGNPLTYYLTKINMKSVDKTPKFKPIKDKTKKLLGKWQFDVKSSKEYRGNQLVIRYLNKEKLNQITKKWALVNLNITKTNIQVNLPSGLIHKNKLEFNYKIDSIKNNILNIHETKTETKYKVEFLSAKKIKVQIIEDGTPLEFEQVKLFFNKKE